MLRINDFYVQRPPWPNEYNEVFKLVMVKAIIPAEKKGLQWGAWVQVWDLATSGAPDACYYSDPWWASSAMADGQRFSRKFGHDSHNQPWTYAKSELSEFQDGVAMTNVWARPKSWEKEFVGGEKGAHGVPKRGITKASQKKLRQMVLRFNDDEVSDE